MCVYIYIYIHIRIFVIYPIKLIISIIDSSKIVQVSHKKMTPVAESEAI